MGAHDIPEQENLRFSDRYPIHQYLAYSVAFVHFERKLLTSPIIRLDAPGRNDGPVGPCTGSNDEGLELELFPPASEVR